MPGLPPCRLGGTGRQGRGPGHICRAHSVRAGGGL